MRFTAEDRADDDKEKLPRELELELGIVDDIPLDDELVAELEGEVGASPNLGVAPMPAPGAKEGVPPALAPNEPGDTSVARYEAEKAALLAGAYSDDPATASAAKREYVLFPDYDVWKGGGGDKTEKKGYFEALSDRLAPWLAPTSKKGREQHAKSVWAGDQEKTKTQAPLEPWQEEPDLGYGDAPPDGEHLFRSGAGGSYSVSETYGPGMGEPPEFKENPIFKEAAEQSKAAVQKIADLSELEAESAKFIREDALERAKAAFAEEERLVKENMEYQQKMSEDIRTAKIDPNRFYGSMSSGQKASAVFSVVLGGLGATLSGIGRGGKKGNVGLDILNRIAAEDVEAQKANLANKHSHLRALVQQGHDIASAMKIAQGNILKTMSLELEMNATEYAGDKEQAKVGMLQAGLDVESQKLVQEGIKNDIEIRYKPWMYEAQMAHLQQQRHALRVSAQADAEKSFRKEEVLWRLQNKDATDADWREVTSNPKEYGDIPDRLIKMPNGKYGVYNGEGAKDFRKRVHEINNMRTTLKRLLFMAEENDKAALLGKRLPYTRDAALVLSKEAILAKVKGSGMGAWDSGLEKLLDAMIIDPSGFFTMPKNSIAALKTLIETGDLEYQALLDGSLAGPNQGRSTSRRKVQ